MSVTDPYKGKKRQSNPEDRDGSRNDDRELTPPTNDIPKTKKVRVDKI